MGNPWGNFNPGELRVPRGFSGAQPPAVVIVLALLIALGALGRWNPPKPQIPSKAREEKGPPKGNGYSPIQQNQSWA